MNKILFILYYFVISLHLVAQGNSIRQDTSLIHKASFRMQLYDTNKYHSRFIRKDYHLSDKYITNNSAVYQEKGNSKSSIYSNLKSLSGINKKVLKRSDAASSRQTPWQWLQPSVSGYNFYDVFSFDENVIIAVGGSGTIVKTVNGGLTWDVINSGVGNSDLNAITFVNEDEGFICGNDGVILKTTNKGDSWIKLSFHSSENLINISFPSKTTGYVLGNSVLATTNDGGLTWSNIDVFKYFPQKALYKELCSCQFNNSKDGYSTGIYYYDEENHFIPIVLKTSDSGVSWSVSQNDTTQIGSIYNDIIIKKDSSVSVLGYDMGPIPFLLKSVDKGISWNKTYLPSSIGLPKDIRFIENGLGVIVGFYGIISSSDNGHSWQEDMVDDWTPFMSCFIAKDNSSSIPKINLYATGWGGLILKKNISQGNWSHITSGLYYKLNDIHLFDSRNGIATTLNGGKSFYTSNGGISWLEKDDPYMCNSMYFLDSLSGYAVGYGGTIMKTTDSGISWNELESGVTANLNEISFIDDVTGYCVGYNGVILKTTDGGKSWKIKNSNINELYVLFGIDFVDRNIGFAVGCDYSKFFWADIILKTTDGGNTWEKVRTLSYDAYELQGLKSIYFINTLIGFTTGDGGKILKTTDGGLSWYRTYSDENARMNDIKFIDNKIGYAAGWGSLILKTTDGGEHWISDFPRSDYVIFTKISFLKNSNGYTGYIIGDSGQILCCAISPLPSKIWTWTGVADSSWNNTNNWSPLGTPVPGDSVIVPQSVRPPVIYEEQQQIVIAGLNIKPGGRLTITDALKRFVVLGDVKIGGTLELRNNAQTSIVVGGNWVVKPGVSLNKVGSGQSVKQSDVGFSPGNSTVYFAGSGTIENRFYNVVVDTNSLMSSSGNIIIEGQLVNMKEIRMRSEDILYVNSSEAKSIIGKGRIIGGTIIRQIAQGSVEPFQYESKNTYVKFGGNGTYPKNLSMKENVNANTSGIQEWQEVTTSITDGMNNRVYAKNIDKFSKWVIKKPGGTRASIVKRIYEINEEGGNGFTAELSLSYDESELPVGTDKNDLVLARILKETAVEIKKDEIPNEYKLNQNYPNPFNPSTKIGYSIPKQGRVKIMVYDMLGREVRNLLNEEKVVGKYEIEFNATGLSSGIYFYKIQASDFIQIKKMILLK